MNWIQKEMISVRCQSCGKEMLVPEGHYLGIVCSECVEKGADETGSEQEQSTER